MYEMPMRSMCGLRPARLSCIQRRNMGSKHPGSSCGYPGIAGRQVHSFDPLRRSRYSPPGADVQSSRVASLVTNSGPARNASAIFSASVTGNRSDDSAKAVAAIKRTVVSSFITAFMRIMDVSFCSFEVGLDLLRVLATLTEISLPNPLACHEVTDRTESRSCLWRRQWRCGIRHIRSQAFPRRSSRMALDGAQK